MKKELFVEYVAPEMEVVLTKVEAGFEVSDIERAYLMEFDEVF